MCIGSVRWGEKTKTVLLLIKIKIVYSIRVWDSISIETFVVSLARFGFETKCLNQYAKSWNSQPWNRRRWVSERETKDRNCNLIFLFVHLMFTTKHDCNRSDWWNRYRGTVCTFCHCTGWCFSREKKENLLSFVLRYNKITRGLWPAIFV